MTLVKVKVNFPQITDYIRKAVERGVDNAVGQMSAEMQAMLSRPGSGRVYVIRTKKGYNKRALRALKKANVRTIRGKFFRYVHRIGLANALRQMRKEGRRNPKTIRVLGFHKASSPGQPPARDTGHLARSWQNGYRKRGSVERHGNRYTLVIGSILEYAKFLEFGTSDMKARPYVRPVAEIMRRRTPLIINEAVADAVARLNRRGSK